MPRGVSGAVHRALCAVLLWSVVVHVPWYRHAHERAIAARLGWQARLASASTPRPGTLLYRWLELSDPDNGQLLARLPYVEIETCEVVTVRLPYPAIINGTRLDAFWSLMRDLARTTPGSGGVRFEAQNLTLHLAAGDQTIDGHRGRAGARRGLFTSPAALLPRDGQRGPGDALRNHAHSPARRHGTRAHDPTGDRFHPPALSAGGGHLAGRGTVGRRTAISPAGYRRSNARARGPLKSTAG